jgi:hypothetical protein
MNSGSVSEMLLADVPVQLASTQMEPNKYTIHPARKNPKATKAIFLDLPLNNRIFSF